MAREYKAIPVGYAGLIQIWGIKTMPHFRQSYILEQGTPYSELENHHESHYYRRKYFPKDLNDPINHLEFALKYDGINLEILLRVFQKIDPQILENYIRSQPSSKLARKIWYLYEFLTEKQLNLKDATGGNYTLLLDPKIYYTGAVLRSRRHYIDDNLLGTRTFCPFVRRTPSLQKYEEKNFPQVARQLLQKYDPSIIARAVNYLYVKETMSSYEIEREKPDSARTMRFVEALKKADLIGALTKEVLIELQNTIVDPRFADKDYRNFQNYIGRESRLDLPSMIDYISPKPEDVPSLMLGLLESLERMMTNKVDPVVAASAISFGFVFIHPFEDGNGRLHRFIIHYLFARTSFVPKGVIFPVSAVILKERMAYDVLLETISKPLMALIKHYQLDKHGELTVQDETAPYYRYLDYTLFAQYLFDCVEKTIYTDFKQEITYLIHYDQAKKELQELVDMPDKKLHLFIQLVLQNHGSLSSKKRERFFPQLTDEEVTKMEAIVRENMHPS